MAKIVDALEAWSELPLERLRALEEQIYGHPLSSARLGTEWRTKRQPDPRMDDLDLAGYIADLDRELAAQPSIEPLHLEQLTNRQLEQLAGATSREQAAEIERQIRASRKPRRTTRKVRISRNAS